MPDEKQEKREPAGQEAEWPVLRLARPLAERAAKLGGVSKLEDAIKEAIADHMGGVIDRDQVRPVERRKLKLIIENQWEFGLSVRELRGLDIYLQDYGESLAVNPIFEKPALLEELARTRRTVFMVGSKPDRQDMTRLNVSAWDLDGITDLQESIGRYSTGNPVATRRIPLRPAQKARQGPARDLRDDLFGRLGPSLVSVASSRSNEATEWTLARMFDRPVFTPRTDASDRSLPFYFVWPADYPFVIESQFHLGPEDVRRDGDAAMEAHLRKNGSGLYHATEGYLADELSDADEGWTYSVCAAQRRGGDRIWLVVAGLTGAATYAAAQWAHKLPIHLAGGEAADQPSRVTWAMLRTRVKRVGELAERRFEFGLTEMVGSVGHWSPDSARHPQR